MEVQNSRVVNSINTLRFLAAFQVMWGHMLEHLDIYSSDLFGWQIGAVTKILQYFMGVPLFFFISGYLINFSIRRSKNTKDYFKKRFWRIYPELWTGITVEIFTILIFYKAKINWLGLGIFAVTQGTVLQFWTPGFLRGYGCGTPNGSLWTICVTVQFYIIVWLTRKLWRNWGGVRFWIASTAMLMAIGGCTGIVQRCIPDILYKLYCQTIVQYLWIFWLGLFAAEYSDKLLPILKKYWWAGIAFFVVWQIKGIDVYARSYPIFLTTISCFGCLGMAYALPQINIKTDISYAMFIYHMIFVNIMISVGWTGMRGLIVVTVLTLLLAYLSTVFVGKWSMKKSHWGKTR